MNFFDFKEEMKYYLKELNIALNEDQMQKLYIYMNLLIEQNKVMNLTSITDSKEIITKHFIDSLTISKFLENNSKVIDIGTGAGFPGIPLIIHNDTLNMFLLDSLNKRINFLNNVIKENNLNNITTIHGRAEDYGKDVKFRESFNYAVSRAVAPLNILLEYMLPFVKLNGMCICMKGNMGEEELNNAKKAIKILGGNLFKIEEFYLPNTDYKRKIVLVKKTNVTPFTFPRKAGTPQKSPI